MKISDIRLEKFSGSVRASAQIHWEESSHPALDLYFETDSCEEEDFWANPDAFLSACAPVALRDGEKRLRVEGRVCPRLRDGVAAALQILGSWYHPDQSLPRIEAAGGFHPPRRAVERAGFFASGGADSLHTLWSNRQRYPSDHPASLRDGIFLESHSFPEDPPSERARDIARRGGRTLRSIAERTGIRLLTVRSNYGRLTSDIFFVVREAQSASLAAAAHLISRRLTSASIASSFRFCSRVLNGSDPLLDPLFGSASLEVLHDGVLFSRAEKIRQMRNWDVALEQMLVCFEGPLGEAELNCGRCEKCLRTMTALEAAGCLDRATAFPRRRLTAADLEVVPVGYIPEAYASSWEPMIPMLREAGRNDLARVVERNNERVRQFLRRIRDTGWRTRLKNVDARYLKGSLKQLRRWASPPPR